MRNLVEPRGHVVVHQRLHAHDSANAPLVAIARFRQPVERELNERQSGRNAGGIEDEIAHAPLAALERGIRHGGDPVREGLLVHGVEERGRVERRSATDENEAVHPRAESEGQVARDVRAEGASDETEPS